ncbi:MAG: hypothetical protein ACHQF3_02875 [Alphaproteobacteria bacterium]
MAGSVQAGVMQGGTIPVSGSSSLIASLIAETMLADGAAALRAAPAASIEAFSFNILEPEAQGAA